MITSMAICALAGFGLGLRLGLFGFLSASILVTAVTLAVGFSFLEAALSLGAFQLAALASMVVRHSTALRDVTREVQDAKKNAPVAQRQHMALR